MEDFKSQFSFEERKLQATAAMKKYTGRIPVFVYSKNNTENIQKNKFLVPNDITVGQFVYIIRKNIKLESNQGIFIFIDNILPPTSKLMSEMYREHGEEDGFLYVALPHGFILFFRIIWGMILYFLAWWVVLFTAEYPKSWHQFWVETYRWQYRVIIYLSYMSDEYPPFNGKE